MLNGQFALEENVSFKNCRGDLLSGVLHVPETAPARAAAILCHGMDSSKNSGKLVFLGDALAARGLLALRFDFAYVGESNGKFEDLTCSGEVEDLRAAYEFVQTRHSGRIAIFGSSLGGTVALLFAARERDVAALVTLAAPVHPENFPRRILNAAQLEEWRRRGFIIHNGQRMNVSLLDDLEKIDVPAAAREIRCPVLILHGDADLVVPPADGRELYECLPGVKHLSILPGGDHRISDPALMRRALGEAQEWLIEHVE
jgi:pimeloyl-ACP methyl ester carboxylesterase